MFDFYSRYTPIARKPHKCEMCGDEIKPGEKYSYESGKYFGEFFVRNMHLDCAAVLYKYCSEVDSEFDWWGVSDYWRDTHCYKCKSQKNGSCTESNPCEEAFDRVCWCTKFEDCASGDEQ